MKFGQLIEYNVKNIFFKNYAEHGIGRLVHYLFLFYLKSFIWGKSKWSAQYFEYIFINLDLDI